MSVQSQTSTLLDDYAAAIRARDEKIDRYHMALVDVLLLCRRIARAKTPEKRADLLIHAQRIGDEAGCTTATILRSIPVDDKP